MPITHTPHIAEENRTRIARFFLRGVDGQSPLLPDDRWILKNARDAFLSNKPLLKNIAVICGLGLLTAGLAGAGALAAFYTASTALAVLAAGTAALGGIVTARAASRSIHDLRAKTLPTFLHDMRARYITLKSDEILSVWHQRLADKKKSPDVITIEAVAKNPENKGISGIRLGKWVLKTAYQTSARRQNKKSTAPELKTKPPAPKDPHV